MKGKDFHGRVLQGGIMPVAMVRACLLGLKLRRDYTSSWKFVGEMP
jgi:hypothetical protein